MPRTNFHFAILIILAFVVVSTEGQTTTGLESQKDREARELTGPVHIVEIKRESIFSAPDEKPIDGGWIPSLTTYDRAGNVIEFTAYDERGEVDYKSFAEVDRSGNKIKETYLDPHGKLKYTLTWAYDQGGNQIEYKSTEPDGTITMWEKYFYDKSGNMISHCALNKDGVILSVTDGIYNEQGKMIAESWRMEDPKSFGRNSYSYKNGGKTQDVRVFNFNGDVESRYVSADDEKNNHIEETYDASDKLVAKEIYEYIRDDKGNWTTEICSEWQLRDSEMVLLRKVRTTRKITYF